MLNFLDETAAVDQVNYIVVAGGTKMLLGKIAMDALFAKYLRAVGAQFRGIQFLGAEEAGKFVHFDYKYCISSHPVIGSVDLNQIRIRFGLKMMFKIDQSQ